MKKIEITRKDVEFIAILVICTVGGVLMKSVLHWASWIQWTVAGVALVAIITLDRKRGYLR